MKYLPQLFLLLVLGLASSDSAAQLPPSDAASASRFALPKIPDSKPRNIVYILIDDLRYDAMGFMGHPFLQTPHIDRLAREGVHCQNAFVTTALCSPSRASVLTGLYAHTHGVVDNNNPVRTDLVFFPQYLQSAGYETAFMGKWHMGGEHDDPQRGFDYWLSFRGQGVYWPKNPGTPNATTLNINGKRVPQKGYITDELSDYAVEWISQRKEKPFFLYLSHKAAHAEFIPADRHKGKYQEAVVKLPETHPDTPENYAGKPRWVKDQRNSWHGVDYPYHSDLDVREYYKRYCETILAVDDCVGRLIGQLEKQGILDSTLIVFMGDNGFLFGEHGLIDKRNAYEESMRVPLVMRCPELFKGGSKVAQVVANIDIAPTLLETAGLQPPGHLQGRSFLPLARGQEIPWRDVFLYEYYWERNFPQTPTIHALRGDQFKYIRYQGIWDTDELYDIQADPHETRNLIQETAHAGTVKQMNRQLFQLLKETGGMSIPLLPDAGGINNKRRIGGSEPGEFPPVMLQK